MANTYMYRRFLALVKVLLDIEVSKLFCKNLAVGVNV